MFRRTLRDSIVRNFLARTREHLQAAVADSWVCAVPRRMVRARQDARQSARIRLGRAIREGSKILNVVTNSAVYESLARIPGAVRQASPHSTLSDLTRAGRQFTTRSWLYRWLTAEPDPDVIVIDLRETLTVGPWLAALERGLRWLLPAAATSVLFGTVRRCQTAMQSRPVQLVSLLVGTLTAVGLFASAGLGVGSTIFVGGLGVLALLAVIGSRVTWSWADLRETRGYQMLAAAFEPPEPPERAHDNSADSSPAEDDPDRSELSDHE